MLTYLSHIFVSWSLIFITALKQTHSGISHSYQYWSELHYSCTKTGSLHERPWPNWPNICYCEGFTRSSERIGGNLQGCGVSSQAIILVTITWYTSALLLTMTLYLNVAMSYVGYATYTFTIHTQISVLFSAYKIMLYCVRKFPYRFIQTINNTVILLHMNWLYYWLQGRIPVEARIIRVLARTNQSYSWQTGLS